MKAKTVGRLSTPATSKGAASEPTHGNGHAAFYSGRLSAPAVGHLANMNSDVSPTPAQKVKSGQNTAAAEPNEDELNEDDILRMASISRVSKAAF